MDNINRWWLKSKIFLTNIISAILSILMLFSSELSDLLNDNLSFLKDYLTQDKLLIALIVLALVNAISKTKKNQDTVVLKKKNDNVKKKTKKTKEADNE